MVVTVKTLVLTIGLPRSGKSTWARQQGVPIVNPDAIRLAIHGQPFVPSAEPLVWVTAKIMTRSLFGAGHDVVILDATNLSRQRREEWYSDDWVVQMKPFLVPPDVCVRRAVASDRLDLVPVIERMSVDFYRFCAHDHEEAVFIDNVDPSLTIRG
jgi:predicted kinase